MAMRREGIGAAPAVLIVVVVVLVISTLAIATFNAAASSSSSSESTSATYTTTSLTSDTLSGSSSSSMASTVLTSTESGSTNYVASQYGLQLQLSINAAQVATGGTIQVNVTELNTLGQENDVNKSSDWLVPVALSACPNTNVQPFGIAVYKGYYTAQNVSLGTQVPTFPPTVCPLYERLVTGYLFEPHSDLATVLPGSGATPMSASIDVVNGTLAGGGQEQPLDPGLYTLVAADEWGSLAILYFQIQGLP
jgi:hypothetical protein